VLTLQLIFESAICVLNFREHPLKMIMDVKRLGDTGEGIEDPAVDVQPVSICMHLILLTGHRKKVLSVKI